MTDTAPVRPERPQGVPAAVRVAVALVAVVTVITVGLAGMFASPASARTLRRPETRVAAFGLAAGQMVGTHQPVLAGQRRARAPSYDQTAVGSCVAAETEPVGVSMGPGAAHISDPALGSPSEEFGPFHRLESLTQTPEVAQLQEQSGEIWGTTPRWGFEPTVQAYQGPLPEGARGVEFTTEYGPNRSAPPGQAWWQEGPGVRVEGDWAKLSCVVTRNTQSC